MQLNHYVLSILFLVFFINFSAKAQPVSVYHQDREKDTLVEKKWFHTQWTITDAQGNVVEVSRVKDGRKHGKQEKYKTSGQLREVNHYKKGLLDGERLLYDYQENLTLEENYKALPEENKSVLHGLVKRYSNNQLLTETHYKNGKKDGKYRTYYNGELKEKGKFKADLKVGNLKSYDNKGSLVREANYVINTNEKEEKVSVLDGNTKSYHNGLVINDCNYKLGEKHGECKEYFKGEKHRLHTLKTYKNGDHYRDYIDYDQNGTIERKGTYYYRIVVGEDTLQNVYEGKRLEYFPNGKLKRLYTWKNYKLNGPSESYKESGEIYTQSFFIDNLKTGMVTVWDKEGHKTHEIPYVIKEKDSVKVSEKEGIETYWEHGKLASTVTYLNDKRNGAWTEYYHNGQVKSEKRFKDDQLYGKAKTYYEDGSLKSESNYQELYSSYEFIGWNYRYDEQGNLTSRFFGDDKGEKILSEGFEHTEKTGLGVKDVLNLDFLPAGKLMSLDVIRFAHLPLLGFDFYSNGKLRRIKFTNKDDFHVKTVSLSAQGDVIEVESNDRSTEENKVELIKMARKIEKSFNPEWLESDLVTKPLEDKVYTLAYKDGSSFMRIQFKEGLPHGKWKIMSSVSKDTLLYAEFDHGKPIYDWIKKKADGTALDRKYFRENQVVLKAENYFTDGRVKTINTSNPDASRKTQLEYYENGQLRTWEDYNNQTRAQFKENGDYYGRTYFKKEVDSVKIRETYFQERNQLQNIRLNNLISKKGYVKSYYENGQLKTYHELLDDQTDGVYKKYDEQGNLVTEGHFKEKKRDGSWKEYENGTLVKESYFEKGEIIIDPKKEAPCACYDKTLRADEIGFAQLTDNLATFSDYEPYLPSFLVPHMGLKNENFFFINFQGSQERDYGNFYMKLLMYHEFSFYLPANKQVKINLNACKVEGYISNMRASFGYNHKNKTINSVNFQPKRIAISLENNPLKAEENKNFSGSFDVNTFYISEKDIQVDYKKELNPCFTEGIINDFLHVEVLEGKPSLQVDRKTQNHIKNYRFPVLRAESENFHGFEITDALLSFDYKQDGKLIEVEASSDTLFAGNNFVASTMQIKGTKLDEDTFQLASSKEKIDLKKLERFLEQKNLYRLKIDFSKKEEVLKIQFFAE